jgi:hypothetical protein
MTLLSIIQKIARIRLIITKMTGNPYFTSPNPTLAVVATATNNLEAAEIKAKTGGKEDTANMYDKEEILDQLVKQLSVYVESVANNNPATAETVILSSGFEIKSKGTREVLYFTVVPTGNPGEVRLQIKAGNRVVYEFQISIDITNEANWHTFNIGTRSRIVKGELAPNTRYYFRARTLGSTGPSEWSEIRSVYLLG